MEPTVINPQPNSTPPTPPTPKGPSWWQPDAPVANATPTPPVIPDGAQPIIPGGAPIPVIPAAESLFPTPAAVTGIPNSSENSAPYTAGTPGAPVTPITPTGMSIMSPPKNRKKKLFLIGGLLTLAILLAGGYVFGYYIPNRPENVWKTSIKRSGEAFNKLITSATEPSKLDSFKKSDITMNIDATYAGGSYKGSFDVKFDAAKSNGELTFASKNEDTSSQSLNAKFMSELAANSQYPNIYFQISGLRSLGLDSFMPALAEYDGTWISVDAAYLQSLGNVPTAEETDAKELASEDIAELARTAAAVTAEYVFNPDPQKAVFEQRSFVGKEKINSINTYHYQVGIDQNNARAYCRAMIERITATDAYKKLPWVNETTIERDTEQAIKECQDISFEGIDKQVFDLWVDTKYKLIYKIRAADVDTPDVYTEIGQVYRGGDDVSLFVAYHDESNQTDGKFTLDINMATNTTKGTFVLTGKQGDDEPYIVTINVGAQPYDGDVQVQPPANTVPLRDVLQKLGLPAQF